MSPTLVHKDSLDVKRKSRDVRTHQSQRRIMQESKVLSRTKGASEITEDKRLNRKENQQTRG